VPRFKAEFRCVEQGFERNDFELTFLPRPQWTELLHREQTDELRQAISLDSELAGHAHCFTKAADIFISYTSSDRYWAYWIAKELETLGHTPHVHEWEVNAGDDIYKWMETRVCAADHVLCVISDEYLKAPYSRLEHNAALWQAAAKRPGFVLLVAVKPCTMPVLADHIRRCELFGIPEDAARIRFKDFMSKRVSVPWRTNRSRSACEAKLSFSSMRYCAVLWLAAMKLSDLKPAGRLRFSHYGMSSRVETAFIGLCQRR
jgi:TIR domain